MCSTLWVCFLHNFPSLGSAKSFFKDITWAYLSKASEIKKSVYIAMTLRLSDLRSLLSDDVK
jgi:hypothetical protein